MGDGRWTFKVKPKSKGENNSKPISEGVVCLNTINRAYSVTAWTYSRENNQKSCYKSVTKTDGD